MVNLSLIKYGASNNSSFFLKMKAFCDFVISLMNHTATPALPAFSIVLVSSFFFSFFPFSLSLTSFCKHSTSVVQKDLPLSLSLSLWLSTRADVLHLLRQFVSVSSVIVPLPFGKMHVHNGKVFGYRTV